MAGDWIKIENKTPDKPEIIRLADILNIDQDSAFGKCFRVWSWADQQTVNGDALSVTETFLDRLVACKGFASALSKVGWLKREGETLVFPNFLRHNGQTSKNRALTKNRTEFYRTKCDDASVTESSPEKRREEKNKEEEKKSEVSDLSHPDKSKSQKKIFDETSVELEAAKFFWSYLREWSPSAIEPSPANYQAWAKDIDAMFRIDHRSTRAFNELLDWIDRQPESKSGFSWRKNIHSPASLRQRWREGKFADFLPTELSKEEFR